MRSVTDSNGVPPGERLPHNAGLAGAAPVSTPAPAAPAAAAQAQAPAIDPELGRKAQACLGGPPTASARAVAVAVTGAGAAANGGELTLRARPADGKSPIVAEALRAVRALAPHVPPNALPIEMPKEFERPYNDVRVIAHARTAAEALGRPVYFVYADRIWVVEQKHPDAVRGDLRADEDRDRFVFANLIGGPPASREAVVAAHSAHTQALGAEQLPQLRKLAREQPHTAAGFGAKLELMVRSGEASHIFWTLRTLGPEDAPLLVEYVRGLTRLVKGSGVEVEQGPHDVLVSNIIWAMDKDHPDSDAMRALRAALIAAFPAATQL